MGGLSKVVWQLEVPFIFEVGVVVTKLHDFPYLVKRRSHKNGSVLKMNATMDLVWII